MLSLDLAPYGFVTFALWWGLHVLLWRLFEPRKDLRAALFFFGLIPLLVLLVTVLASWRQSYLVAAGLFFLLSLNYLILYPALQASSPTVKILCLLRASPKGTSPGELISQMNQSSLQKDRVEDLRAAGLIRPTPNGWALTASGARLSFLFSFYRRLLGLVEGKG